MILIVHSETTAATIGDQLGRAEYSYYFVLREFRPLLERLGIVVAVADPKREVDAIFRNAANHGQQCVFLSFSPPHRTEIGLQCPTVPVFAWEFDTLPDEMWDQDRRNNWVWALRRLGRAIVHSEGTAELVRRILGAGFPVQSIPSPVWDRFAPLPGAEPRPQTSSARLRVRGTVIDSRELDYAALPPEHDWAGEVADERERHRGGRTVEVDGVVYTSVFNPEDGRKNWPDMVSCFCRSFADEPSATLFLKLTHFDGTQGLAMIMRLLSRLAPFACRVVLVHGFLEDDAYAAMVDVTSYVVNCAHGEGQCLPLMEFMSAGKPAIAPPHTGMADYVAADCAFLVDSSAEPTFWPQDPRRALRTCRRRIDATSLDRAYIESFTQAVREPARYAAMSRAAVAALRRHCGAEGVLARLRAVIEGALADAAGQRPASPSKAPEAALPEP